MNDKNSTNPLDSKKKATDIITLRDLLAEQHVFRIPDYQRGYAWHNEFIVLWQDILRLYRTGNRKHYTGMLALEEITSDSIKEAEAIPGTTAFYVVDGQQRITSLVIILNSLITYIKDELPNQDTSLYDNLLIVNDVIYRFGYSCKRQDGATQFFENRIFKNNIGLSHADKYLSNINFAKEFIDKELNRVSGDTALEILNSVLDCMVFNLYFVTDDFDVRVTFETINNRGKRLSNLELLKNRLMYLSTFFPAGNAYGLQLISKINTAWQSIYKNLCFGDEQLPDDDYLKAHWIAYGRLNKRKGDAYIDDLLGSEFAIDSGVFQKFIAEHEYLKAYQHIKEYIDSLSKYSLFWAFVNKPDEVSINLHADEIEWIKRLSRISNTIFLRAALMIVVAENSLVLADKSRYYSKVELFIFTNKLLAQDSNDLSFLVTSAKKLLDESANKTQAFQDIINDIDNHDLHVDAQRVKTAIDAFKLNVLDKKSNYYYDWNGLSYFLYEYNDSLSIQNAAPIQWYQLSSTSIEHVLPQTPVSIYWKTAFGKYSDDEKKIIINSLGNLLLLSCGSENSSLKNYSFPVKKDMSVESKKFAYSDGSRSAREIATNDCWTINEVSARSDKLIQFMYDHWFSALGITSQDWKQCIINLKNNLPESMSVPHYNSLKASLLLIDTSDERRKADDAVKVRTPDYLQQQFMGYIDTDLMPIKYNSKKIYYKDWFTFKIISENGIPSRLECGVDVNNKGYRVRYRYDSNEIDVNHWNSNSEEEYLMDIASLPEKLRPFVLSLFRYLRKAFGKSEPIWINRT